MNDPGRITYREEPRWLYAVRITGWEGWLLEESNQSVEDFRGTVRERGLEIDELVEVYRYTARLPSDDVGPPNNYFRNSACREGWGYDARAQCWRAPHELDRRFPGPTVDVDRIEVSYALPELGWMDTAIRAGGHTVEFSMSDTYNPIPDLLRWLERLADGEFGRLLIDCEGWYVDFHVFADGDRVRFVIEDGEWKRTLTMDLRIDRIALLAGFYCPLVTLWENEAFARAYNDWEFDWMEPDRWEDDPESMTPVPIRSARIDAVLRAAGWGW